MSRRHGQVRGMAILCTAAVAAALALITLTGCRECISPVIESGEQSIENRGRRDRQFEEAEPEREER